MEEDPEWKKLAQKSFIMRKMQTPMIPKRPRLKHQAFSSFFLTTASYFTLYPLDTIKVRIQSQCLVDDVSHFSRNNVEKLNKTAGIFRGYGVLVIGNVFQLTLSRMYNLYVGAVCEGLLKTWLEMSKVGAQMGIRKPDLALIKFSWANCAAVGVARDVVFRGVFVNLLQYFTKGLSNNDKSVYLSSVMTASSLATIVSHPFDVLFSKFASQQEPKYGNIIKGIKLIIKEQGYSKLLGSGLVFRILYNVPTSLFLAACYEDLLKAAVEAF